MKAPATDHRLAEVPLFADFSPATLDFLARASRVRTFPKGQVICSEGDPGDCLLVLEQGRVRVSRFMLDGQEIVLSVVDAPAAFGEIALIDGGPRSATITASGPLTLRLIDRAAFLEAVEREPPLALARALSCMVRATNERLADLLTLDVPGRVAKWLLAHAVDQTTDSVVPFNLSQSDLAVELGAARISVNRALKSFEHFGAISVNRDCIVITKPDVLRQYVR